MNLEVTGAVADKDEQSPIDQLRLTRPQRAFVRDARSVVLWRDGNQLGKAQPTSARVATPHGWRPIGDLRVGDEILAGDGSRTRVTAVYPQGLKPVYRMIFDDGAVVECCREHLWTCMDGEARFRKGSSRYGQWSVRPLGEILDRWGATPTPRSRVAIPTPDACAFSSQPVPLDPYLLGVLIGDGSLAGCPLLTNPDAEVVGQVMLALPEKCQIRRVEGPRCPGWRISGIERGRNEVTAALRELGLWKRGSHERFVPECYRWNAPAVRLAILQGLLDTDGSVTCGCVEYTTTSRRLARDVRFLARSLGGKVKIGAKRTHYRNEDGEAVPCRIAYRVRIRLPRTQLFRLHRKQAAIVDPVSTTDHRVLYRIRPAGEAQCVCITVAHPSQTYVTDGFIVTHNSTALAYDAIQRARGLHPTIKVRPPVDGLVIGVSWEQMMPLMKRLWQLLPKDEISPKVGFEPGRGITGKPARIVFERGPGAGSVIALATYKQGSTRIAGATLHWVTMDEPPPEAMYAEVQPRLLRHGGHLRIGMTPTMDMPPQAWLRKLVEGGEIAEYNWGLAEEHCWPLGDPRPWIRQRQIAAYERSLLPAEREMRMRGSWDPIIAGRWLDGFTTENVSELDPPLDAYWGIGIDHALTSGRQTAALCAFANRHSDRPRAWYQDEYRPEAATNPGQDAAGILQMVERNGLEYDDIQLWVGDRVAKSNDRDAEKSNALLRVELGRLLGRRARRIYIPKKFGGSILYGFRLMNVLFQRRALDEQPTSIVHPRCAYLRKACLQFAGDPNDPLKDILDAARYITEGALEPRRLVKFSAG